MGQKVGQKGRGTKCYVPLSLSKKTANLSAQVAVQPFGYEISYNPAAALAATNNSVIFFNIESDALLHSDQSYVFSPLGTTVHVSGHCSRRNSFILNISKL